MLTVYRNKVTKYSWEVLHKLGYDWYKIEIPKNCEGRVGRDNDYPTAAYTTHGSEVPFAPNWSYINNNNNNNIEIKTLFDFNYVINISYACINRG